MKKIIFLTIIGFSFLSAYNDWSAWLRGNKPPDLEKGHRLYLYGIDEYQMGHLFKAKSYFKESCHNYGYIPACHALEKYGLK